MDTSVNTLNVDIKKYVKALKHKEIKDFFDVPVEIRNHPDIVKIERKLKLRRNETRGYDVINNYFFVNEAVIKIDAYDGIATERIHISTFDYFDEYYAFLDGDIYVNACYYQFFFDDELVTKYKIRLNEINYRSLITETIDDCVPSGFIDKENEYREAEKKKANIKSWIKKYNACTSFEELYDVNRRHRESSDNTNEIFYIWNYINTKGATAIDIIMQFVNDGLYTSYRIEYALGFIFGFEPVVNAYRYSGGAPTTNYKHNSRFKANVRKIQEKGAGTNISKYFDKSTHFFCIRTDYYFADDYKERSFASSYKYFETFEEFIKNLDGDLSDCNLLEALLPETDLSKYKINQNTKLPVSDIDSLSKEIKKRYNRKTQRFEVEIKWKNNLGSTVYSESKKFDYFFDFLTYLKSDLSGADLLFCDGLLNVNDFSGIRLDNIRLRSAILDKLCIEYNSINALVNIPQPPEHVIENENNTALILQDEHAEISTHDGEMTDSKIYYISDIHLTHTLIRKGAKTSVDYVYVTQCVIDDMLRDFNTYLCWGCKTILIGGDISSEYNLYELYIKLLRKTINERSLDVTVIFTLGNHELWNQQNKDMDRIVDMYRKLLEENGMYLVQNEILYIENNDNVFYIPEYELIISNKKQIREKLRKARMIIFGGIGFSGCNEDFNANKGIYMTTIDRNQEIQLSSQFENLYSHVVDIIDDRNLIVFTHMNINEWKRDYELHDNYIYISGHSHINTYYDDGVRRLYADNQVGYYNDRPKLKYFLLDKEYDWFVDYEDGIHQISRDDYIEFYRGKNILMNFNRDVNELFMLKRNGYYCFIQRNKAGKLTILNGGALKTLSSCNLDYYYQNMDAQIKYIKTPLSKYQKIQEQISKEIQKLGGNGRIHGAIIDIDGDSGLNGWGSIAYNHLYINPVDLTITPYYALDMIYKYIYPSFPALLNDRCPKMFEVYQKLLEGRETKALVIKQFDQSELMIKPKLYTNTDIYKASRELRKMQKLNSNILSTWYDNIPDLSSSPSKRRFISAMLNEENIPKK